MDYDRYFQFLISGIGTQTAYHNHKETVAWGVIGLYIPSIVGLAWLIRTLLKDTAQCWPSSLAILLFVVLAIMAGLFVCRQFRFQKIAARTVEALMKLANDFSKGGNGDIKKVVEGKCGIQPDKLWPQFIQEKIDSKEISGRSMITVLLTDWVSYFAIAIATLVAIVFVIKW